MASTWATGCAKAALWCVLAAGSLLAAMAVATTPALPADLPSPLPPGLPAEPYYRWNGAYFGAHAGFIHGTGQFGLAGYPDGAFTGLIPPIPTSMVSNVDRFVGGLQLGYLHQIDALVIGVEQDVVLGSPRAAATTSGTASGFPYTLNETQTVDWLATLRGRIGFAPNDQVMIYGTGGLAYGVVTTSSNLALVPPNGLVFANQSHDFRTGWAAGVGVEYALSGELSATLEYLYFDLGHATVVGLPNVSAGFETHTNAGLAGHLVRVGVNYRFDDDRSSGMFDRELGFAPRLKQVDSEIGARYWYSMGRTAKDLYDPAGSAMVSRLTYSGLAASSAEVFGRIDGHGGLFAKGFIGVGGVGSGSLTDEDFPPGISPYSATTSPQRDGSLFYFSGDLGYNLLQRQTYKLGAFAGIFHEREVVNAHGCAQIATNNQICSPTISDPVLAITEDSRWTAARVGLNGEVTLWNLIKINVDGAWLPYVMLDSADTHWLRIQPVAGNFMGPIPQDGIGHNGFQLESVVSYLVSPAFSVGIGARYWRMETSGNAHFEGDIYGGSGSPQPVHFVTERYGGFLQGAFKF
jgi:opacity protein-like surface antigen